MNGDGNTNKEGCWDSPLKPCVITTENTKLGKSSPEEKKRRKNHDCQVSVPVFYLAGIIITGLIVSHVILWICFLRSKPIPIKCACEGDGGANKEEDNFGDGHVAKRERRTATDYITVDEALDLQDRILNEVKSNHLSAHLAPSPNYGRSFLVPGRSELMWSAEQHLTHNNIFNISLLNGRLAVRKGGYYSIRAAVTFNGRNDKDWTETPSCTITLKAQNQGQSQSHTLAIASVSQDDWGVRSTSSSGYETYPFDTVPISGIFRLHARSEIYIATDYYTQGCRIDMSPKKTHIDAMYIRPISY